MGNARRPSFKGCCAMCAGQIGKVKGQGWAERLKASERRKLGGKKRRCRRKYRPGAEVPRWGNSFYSPLADFGKCV